MARRVQFWNLCQTFFVLSALLSLALAAWPVGALAQQAATQLEGGLSVVWADPRPGTRTPGEVRFRLILQDGRKVALEIDPQQQAKAIRLSGKRVKLRGQYAPAARGASGFAAAIIDAAAPEMAVVTTAPQVRCVLYILLRFQGDAQEPHPPSFFKQLTNPLTVPAGSNVVATLNGFFNAASYGQLNWKGDVLGSTGLSSTHWLTLPRTKSGYAPCGWSSVCADLDAIETDALALAEARGIDLSVYDNINYVLNNDLDCCAWGGSTFHNGKSYGATWEPPWGQEAGIYSHELGHSIGLPHSGWTYYAYDSPWDQMSSGSDAKSANCGSYFSANDSSNAGLTCTKPGGGYIAAHKDFLNWIPDANKVTISSSSTRTLTLEASARPLSTAIKMIKMCYPGLPCTGASASYLTVEARLQKSPYDGGLPQNGVILHDFQADRPAIGAGNPCFFNSQSGWAVPIDATKGDYDRTSCDSGGRTWPDYALGNAAFQPGQTYSNTTRHVKVKVERKTTTGYVVTVTRTP